MKHPAGPHKVASGRAAINICATVRFWDPPPKTKSASARLNGIPEGTVVVLQDPRGKDLCIAGYLSSSDTEK